MGEAPHTAGGALGNGKLKLATATAADVSSGKTFYAGDKTIKTGEMPAESVRYLATIGITIGYDNNNTTTDRYIDLSQYGVSNKSASDFIIGITSISASAAQTQSRSVNSIQVVSFSNNQLRIRANHTGGYGHAIVFNLNIAIYVK